MRRTVLTALAALAVLCFGAAGLSAASADGTVPPGVGDPFGGSNVPSGPTYVVTPGVGGTKLPAPTDPQHVTQQVRKDRAAAHQVPAVKPVAPAKVSGSTSGSTPASTSASSEANPPESRWWLVASGAVLALVLSEFVRMRFRRTVPVP